VGKLNEVSKKMEERLEQVYGDISFKTEIEDVSKLKWT